MKQLEIDWVPWLSGNKLDLKYVAKYWNGYMDVIDRCSKPATPKIVVISGFFNPLHQGHLDLIAEARKFGDWLVALVNNDKQVALKGGCPFQDEQTRLRLVSSLKGVDEARLTIDTDDSVAESLRVLRPQYFYNGGDRTGMNVNKKELAACTDVGCTMVFGGLNSPKVAASSSLIKNAVRWYLLNKPILLDIEK